MTLEEIVDEIQKRSGRLEVVHRDVEESLPVHVCLIEDEETGFVQYMRLSPDGHLGAIDV